MIRVKTVFTKNTKLTNTVFTTVNSTSASCTLILSYYSMLANALSTINTLMVNFALGNYSEVAQILTLDKYNDLSILLGGLQRSSNTYPDYEIIRTTISNSLQALMQAVNQYAVLVNTNAALTNAQAQASILTDMTKLKAYLESLKGNRYLFPDSSVTITKALIKPQYGEYIKRYGYPPNGIFDTDKLAACIAYVNQVALVTV